MTADERPSSERPDGASPPRPHDFWGNMPPEERRRNEDYVNTHIPWKKMSPEEYVARERHRILMCSLHRYEYSEPALATWMKRFGELLRIDDEQLDQYRRQFLTHDEYAQVQKEIAAAATWNFGFDDETADQ
jgi:hypothetical protein